MTTRLELPDGWADIRDPKKVAYGRRKPVSKAGIKLARYRADLEELAAASKAREASEAHPEILGVVPIGPSEKAEAEEAPANYIPTEEEVEMLEALQEAATVALVNAWSWEFPVSIEGLQELPGDAARELVEHCTVHVEALFTNTDPSPDESSPTTP